MIRLKSIPSKAILGALLFCLSHMPGPSQTGSGSGIAFEQISLPQGLSQSTVKSITQDRLGFIYFGTEDGLNRYDGYRFTVFRHNPGDANSLSYNDIMALCADSRGYVWAGTYNAGLNRYDPASGGFLRFRHDPDDPASLSHDNILAIVEDAAGNIWAGTQRGLNRLSPDPASGQGYRIVRFRHDPDDPESLIHDIVYAFCLDREGGLWIGTGGGLDRLEPRKAGMPRFSHFRHDARDPSSLSNDVVHSLLKDSRDDLWVGTQRGLNRLEFRDGSPVFTRFRHDPGDDASLGHDQVLALQEDKDGALWVGTNGGGICLFDRDKAAFSRYRHDPLYPRSICNDEIRSIYRDRQGIMWIGTYGAGINKVARGAGQFIHFPHIPNRPGSIRHAIVWAIHEDDEGTLWIGTNGGGLDRLDRKSGRLRNYRADSSSRDGLGSDIVRVVRDAGGGTLWIGTHGGGICRFDPRAERFHTYRHDPENPASLAHDEIREIYRDRAGTVWVGTFGHGLDRFDEATGTFTHYRNLPGDADSLSNDYIRVIREDSAGNFWIGTEGGGLNLFDREAGRFRSFRSGSGIAIDYIFAIHEDWDGILWLGTLGGGLTRFDPDNGTFRSYTTRDGLPNNYVFGILEDERGNLWLSTSNGLAMFNRKRESFQVFGVSDGLQDREFNGGSYFQSRSGEMFFGGIHGFNAFIPEKIQSNAYVPPMVIESFQKFNKDVDLGRPVHELKEIRLTHRDTVFSLEFASLDFSAPARNLYAYKMEGLDEEWIETGAEKRFAHFTTVPAGRYVFRVKGSNSDGIWNEAGASLRIVITPPFWQTWWFRVPVLLGALILLFTWNNSRMKRMAARIRTDAAMEQFLDRHDVSAREKEIIRLLLRGKSNREIEEALFISMGTVKNHVYRIFQKLNVKNRGQLIALFQNLKVE